MERCPLERCYREIATIEAELLSGHPDVQGLCLALSDWWAELRIIEAEQRQEKPPGLNPAAGEKQIGSGHALIE
jgi:hypothetical protein